MTSFTELLAEHISQHTTDGKRDFGVSSRLVNELNGLTDFSLSNWTSCYLSEYLSICNERERKAIGCLPVEGFTYITLYQVDIEGYDSQYFFSKPQNDLSNDTIIVLVGTRCAEKLQQHEIFQKLPAIAE